jgi:hypothetical protein
LEVFPVTFSKRALKKGEEGYGLFKSLQLLVRRAIRARRKKPTRAEWRMKQAKAIEFMPRQRRRSPAQKRFDIRSNSIDASLWKLNIFGIRERLGLPQSTPFEEVQAAMEAHRAGR